LMTLTCPECSHQWEVLFDIASFLWTEINNWAERTLRTVHQLASAYGWAEREILNLSPVRRQLYLGMVNR
ncbi:MAG: phage baseplate protein, partial [Chloroflexota bacterium]|nr:phage baseplate protein [Chloroflexota bacterium]